MSFRYPKGGFIQLFFDPLTPGPANEFGPMYVWGANTNGKVGDNTTTPRSSPVQIGTAQNWAKIHASYESTYAISTEKTLWAWGKNNYGYLAQNDTIYRSSPVQVGALTNWSVIGGNVSAICSIKDDGTLWLWGYNAYGQVGDNTTLNRSSPVQIGSETNWSKTSAGWFSAFAIKDTGTLWAWGLNGHGTLGLNVSTSNSYSSPVQVGALTNWKEISGGYFHTAALKTNGTIWTWGDNEFGQLGQNISYVDHRSSPVQVGALTTWLSVVAGQYHCLALKNDGTLWAWGRNLRGQLGTNTAYNVYRSSPVQVGSLTTWAKINTSCWNTSMAIKTDGTLWAWGLGTSGQVGTNTAVNRSSPVQIGSDTDWNQVSANIGTGMANKTS